jgi:hypothetical protein
LYGSRIKEETELVNEVYHLITLPHEAKAIRERHKISDLHVVRAHDEARRIRERSSTGADT